jgi:hypothetical protein
MIIGQKLVRVALVVGLSAIAGLTALAQGGNMQAVNLTTKDGVQLRGTYYPANVPKGSEKAKQATPVVLLHDFKGQRTVFNPLIAKLQPPVDETNPNQPDFAVLAVDLRAHGESNKQIAPDGSLAELDAAKLSKDGLLAMTALDMEAIRSYLVGKNDAGELNINKLCIVGSGMGANVATSWALVDWTAPPLAVGKQGQDVKGLVLISPRWTYNGLSVQDAMKFAPLKKNVAWLIICGGQDTKLKPDIDRIAKQIEKFHPLDEKKMPPGTRSGLEVNRLPASLQGDSLLEKSGTEIDDEIAKFLTENVAAVQMPWTARRHELP